MTPLLELKSGTFARISADVCGHLGWKIRAYDDGVYFSMRAGDDNYAILRYWTRRNLITVNHLDRGEIDVSLLMSRFKYTPHPQTIISDDGTEYDFETISDGLSRHDWEVRQLIYQSCQTPEQIWKFSTAKSLLRLGEEIMRGDEEDDHSRALLALQGWNEV